MVLKTGKATTSPDGHLLDFAGVNKGGENGDIPTGR